MTTPDLRPISALTPAILATASHWALLYDGNASVIKSVELHIDAEGLYARVRANNDIWPVGSYIRIGFPSATCYPCTLQPDGMIVPEPWPMLDGEEEIEEWRGHSHERLEPARIKAYWKGGTGWMWQLESKRKHRPVSELPRIDERPGMRPAPRKGSKWVWEKDR